MAILNKELFLSEKFNKELKRIIREGDLSELTPSLIRKDLEDKFGLDHNSLKKEPWKDMLMDMIDKCAQETEEHSAAESGEDENSDDNDDQVKDKMDTDEDKHAEEESPVPRESPQDDASDNDLHEDNDDDSKDQSDSEKSDVASSPQKRKRQKKEQPVKQKSTGKKGTSTKATQDDESIKRLKSYINKCGVRKTWQKELADCTTKKSQINKLKQMLEELGVHGRPTIEKCETVKAERELKAEIDSLDKDNILETANDGPSLRSSGLSKRKRRPPIQEDTDESGDDHANAPLDVSFLGDQSDDSD